jgi:hypothetical protein
MFNLKKNFSVNYSQATFLLYNLSVIMATLGIAGNIITFLVFLRSRFEKSTFAFYFKIMAITDSFVLLHFFGKWSIHVLGSHLYSNSLIGCKFGYYTRIVFFTISLWILLIISFDRLCSIIIRLHTFTILRKKSFQISLIAIVFIFGLSFPILIPINSKLIQVNIFNNHTNKTETQLVCDNDALIKTPRMISMLNLIIVFFIMNIFSGISIYILYKSRNKMKRRNNNTSEKIGDRNRKYAINSIVLNFFCVVCKTPPIVFYMTNGYVIHDKELFEMIEVISLVVFSLDNASMFFVNMCVNSIFKEQVLLMFKLKNNLEVEFNLTK